MGGRRLGSDVDGDGGYVPATKPNLLGRIGNILVTILSPRDFIEDFLEDLTVGREAFMQYLGYSVVLTLNAIMVLTTFGLLEWPLFIGVVLLGISCANAFVFFTSYKTYQLFNINKGQVDSNPSVHVSRFRPEMPVRGAERRDICELKKWNPSEFTTFVFRYFSPLQVLTTMSGETDNTVSAVFHVCLGYLTMAGIVYIMHRFMRLQKDQSLINAEVYEEYNRFALSRLAVVKVDTGVQVSEDTQTSPLAATQKTTTPTSMSTTTYRSSTTTSDNVMPAHAAVRTKTAASTQTYTPDITQHVGSASSPAVFATPYRVQPQQQQQQQGTPASSSSFTSSPSSSSSSSSGVIKRKKTNPFQQGRRD